MTSAAAPIEDLSASLEKSWFNDDPIMKALSSGTMAWGDIPGICDEVPRDRSPSVSSEESEPEVVRICSHSRRVRFADKPTVKEFVTVKEIATVAPVVPPYTPGIKTIITRNLPRDISEMKLRSIFEKYGPIRDIYIPRNVDSTSPYFGTIKGFALIKFL